MEHSDDMLKIEDFRKRHPGVAVSYGGDGEILAVWRGAAKEGKDVCPVRNYGRCEKHSDPFACVDLDKVQFHRPAVCECEAAGGAQLRFSALSEIQVKSADVTSALRMDVYVDGRGFMQNVIADGVVCSTAFGATGYFSSIARTLFVSGLGFAFVAPTLGVNNMVLPAGSRVDVSLRRGAKVAVAADKDVREVDVEAGRGLSFFVDTGESVGFVGLDVFHCPDCRARRHGTTVVNQYFK